MRISHHHGAWLAGLLLSVALLVPSVAECVMSPATAALNDAFAKQKSGDTPGAKAAFELALSHEPNLQQAHMGLAYVHLRAGDKGVARQHFEAAAGGSNQTMADQARAELALLPRHTWADLYLEGFGWHRLLDPTSTNLVPILRLRAFYRPFVAYDLQVYGFAQATRDTHSRSNGPNGFPLVYADNTAMVGVGALLRLLNGKAGVFARVGPARNLLASGRPTWSLDARIGAYTGVNSVLCTTRSLGLCLEGYGEVVWVNRYDAFNDDNWTNGFDNSVVGMARGRVGYAYLVTGPVRWSPYLEVRGIGDVNGDYWNNVVDAGVGHRWRLLTKVPFSLLVGLHGGRYLGRTKNAAQKLPDPASYLELRLHFATYLQF